MLMDAYAIRREAERIVAEDRVPTDVLQEIVETYGDPGDECDNPDCGCAS